MFSLTKLNNVVNEFIDDTYVDNVRTKDLVDLGQSLQGVNAGRITFVTVPTTGITDADGNEPPRTQDIRALFDAIINDDPLPGENDTNATTSPMTASQNAIQAAKPSPVEQSGQTPQTELVNAVTTDPQDITVQVSNSTGQDGLGSTAATALRQHGFHVLAPDDYTGTVTATTVMFSAGNEQAAATVAAAFPAAQMERMDGLGETVQVVLGPDFSSVAAPPPSGSAVSAGQPQFQEHSHRAARRSHSHQRRRRHLRISRAEHDGCLRSFTRRSLHLGILGALAESRVDAMRTAYHEQLDALTNQLAEMCRMAGVAMERATQSLLQADLVLAEQVITDHEQISAASARAEEAAFVLLALQAPVAGDLRAIVSSIQIVADVDRMGALALHVAKIARRRHPQHTLPEEVNGYFAEMGRVAVDLGNSAREVLLSRDPEKARRIREEDDAMDDLHRHLFTVLMDREWKHGVAAAVDVTLLGRFYERFADHAVEISRRVIFQVTGRLPEEEEIAAT